MKRDDDELIEKDESKATGQAMERQGAADPAAARNETS